MSVESSLITRDTEALRSVASPTTLETVDCSLCGSSDYSQFDSVGEWKIVKCRKCGLGFTNPRPSTANLSSFYTLEYFKDEDENRFALFDKEGSTYLGKNIEGGQSVADIESHFHERGSLLEIGAATGSFLKAMRSRGWRVQGVELSRDAVEAAKQYESVDIFCGPLEAFETEQRFDAICMYHSLEHVPNPAFVIERCYQLLNPNGIVVIEVPNLNAFDIKWSPQRKLSNYDLPLHLSHFTPKVLTEKLEAVGFEILDVDLYYSNFMLGFVNGWSRIRGMVLDSEPGESPSTAGDPLSRNGYNLLPMAKKRINWKTQLMKHVSRLFPGWRFTIVARK